MKRKILISFILALMILCNIKVYATDTAELPSKYDLRNDINIKVENQGTRGWCNVYSYVKMVETYLQKTKGITYDLSEGYIAYSNSINAGSYTGEYVLQSNFPNTIAGVIYQKGAFDVVSDGQINLTPNSTSKKAAQDALNTKQKLMTFLNN